MKPLLYFFFMIALSVHAQISDKTISLEKHLRNDTGNDSLRFELAKLYLTGRNYDDIIDLYKRKFEEEKCTAAEYKLYAVARMQSYEHMVITAKLFSNLLGSTMTHARESLNRVLEKDPHDTEAQFFKGVYYKISGDNKGAEKIFREVIETDPHFKTYAYADPWIELSALLRKQERFNDANTLLEKRVALDSADTWPMIALAISYMDLKNDDRATRTFYRGLERIKDEEKIGQLYLETEPIMDKAEQTKWKLLNGSEEKLRFLKTFWKKHDPNPADNINERLVEHYRRVQYARAFYKKIRSPYFDDRGLIYIRMGKPDRTYAGVRDATWVYESGQAHFDFVEAGSGAYELRPLSDAVSLTGSALERFSELKALVEARRNYDPYYEHMANKMQSLIDRISPERNFSQVTAIAQGNFGTIQQALTSDLAAQSAKQKFDYNIGGSPLAINANFASFKSITSNSSRLDFYFMIPLEQLKYLFVENAEKKSFLVLKMKMFDEEFNEINSLEKEYTLATHDTSVSPYYFILDELRCLSKPGNYLLALDIRSNNNQKAGVYKINVSARDYSSKNLMLSDIQFTSSVSAGAIEDKFMKPNTRLRVVPDPTANKLKSKPLTIYYEIYNLRPDKTGKTSYEVSYRIRVSGKSKNLFSAIGSLFSGKAKSDIRMTTVRSGTSATEHEYLAFDITELSAGAAELEVRVKDLNSAEENVSGTNLTITE